MFEIDKKGNICHTRGDTADFDVNVSIDGQALENFEAMFSVKKRFEDTEYLYQVNVSDRHVHIPHSMTQGLPYGNFYYDIQVKMADETDSEGRYITIGPFGYRLLPDVTTTT